MKVHVYPADVSGCGYLRLIWPAQVLRELGHDVTVFAPGGQDSLPVAVVTTPRGREIRLFAEPQCDVIVLQRPLDWKWAKAIPLIKAAGVRVVCDMDDDFHALQGDHVGFWHVHPRTSPDHNWQHLAEALRHVDMLTATTQALADRYGRAGYQIIPNCVPEAYLEVVPERSEPPCIGWAGTTETHPGDLDVVGTAVRQVVTESGWRFKVIGNEKGIKRAIGLEPELHPWVPINEYAKALSSIDVGIVPLKQHAFNEAKSWLKGLEMASVGVPFVATGTTPYRQLAAEGMGLIAGKPKEWQYRLRQLVASRQMRDDVAGAGREAAARWTIQANAWRWEQAWLGA